MTSKLVDVSSATLKVLRPNLTAQDFGPWFDSQAQAPAKLYEVHASDASVLRFAWGKGGIGAVMWSDESGDKLRFLSEGSADAPEQSAMDCGAAMPIMGLDQLSPERLREVVLHFIAHDGELIDGNWSGAEDNAPLPASDATDTGGGVWGVYTQALIQLVQRYPMREAFDEGIVALADRLERQANLQGYLNALAVYNAAVTYDLHDFWGREPKLQGDKIFLGIIANGDQVLASDDGVEVVSHESGESQTFYDFEDFLCELVYLAHEEGEATSLDEITGESPME